MHVDTDALRWFQQVADGVTVTEVSEIEGVSQPAVSRALARLEGEIGTPLLRRAGRTLRMTHAGSAFKRHVDVLLHQLDDGLAAVNQIIDPETGTVGFAFQASLATWLVPFLVSSFRAEHPGVIFDLIQVRDELVSSVLDSGNADLVLSTVRPTDPSIRGQRLIDEPLRLAVPRDHRLAKDSRIRLADASTEPFLMLRRRSLLRKTCDELCQESGFSPTVGFEGEDIHTLRGFVAAGLGVAIIPSSGEVSPSQGGGRVRYLEISDVRAVREIGLAWSAERRLLPASQVFRDHVITLARQHRLPVVSGTA
ncbi:MAG TPA: LysR family transcriptional regulator [Propionibacteriaceae bacterium]|nr:LysR family transcriptional regulator [Propionibacteriaceae bacterium]